MCQVVNFHLEAVLSKTKMERCCANPLLINIDKSEAVYCLFCEEERVLSYSVKYRYYILMEIKKLSDYFFKAMLCITQNFFILF